MGQCHATPAVKQSAIRTAPSFEARRPARAIRSVAGAGVWLLTRQWFTRLLRAFYPIARLPGWVAVTRYEDVAEVLSRQDIFHVPFSSEIARLNDGENPGTPFILGIDEPNAHDRQLKLVMQAFKRSDVDKIVTLSRDCAQQVVTKAKNGQMEAIGELITHVPLELCKRYYGVDVDILGDRQNFADAANAVSSHLFGPPPIKPKDYSDAAADYVRWFVDSSIESALECTGENDTVLARLVDMHRHQGMSREMMRAFLMGMIIGFVPTNTIVGGNILEMLLRRPTFMEAAREAALAGDDDLLKRCLFEANRFMPHNFGIFRTCSRDYKVAADTQRAKIIKKHTKVLAWTMSAMFDSRQVDNPVEFRPDRPASDLMLFGFGVHYCAGFFIAQAQITQTLKALLIQTDLSRAGKPERREGFPYRLPVKFCPVKSS